MTAVPATDTTVRRRVAALAAGMLLPLAGCTAQDEDSPRGDSGAARDLRVVSRDQVARGGTLRWAIEEMPTTLNVFQPEASRATSRVAGATLPALFTLDSSGRPHRNPDYLTSTEVTSDGPEGRHTVVYTLNPKAEWSDGRDIGVADFKAQWKALRGENGAYWTGHHPGYERITKVTKGPKPHQVKVVFREPYADWKSLFTPLYPKSVMSQPEAFNEEARTRLPVSGGPFRVKKIDPEGDRAVTLVRNRDWWGDPAKLKRIQLTVVPHGERKEALAAGKLDLARVTREVAKDITATHHADGKSGEQDAKPAGKAREQRAQAAARGPSLRDYVVREALAPAYVQLAFNGAAEPLADERVRRALARALDREALAEAALGDLGLPAEPLGSHLRVRDQLGYHDNSGALGGHDLESAQALLADAGWNKGVPPSRDGQDPSVDAKKGDEDGGNQQGQEGDGKNHGDDGKNRGGRQATEVLTKDGQPLALRFLVPDGPGTATIRASAERVARMLDELGVRTRIERVADDSLFRDRVASGDFELALYSWAATAYPATDAAPAFAKPVASAGGSLQVGLNYTRVGTARIDQLFAQASSELDQEKRRELLEQADARIWAAAGSVPLYQRPELVAARPEVANAGAFGFQTPRYQDIGFVRGKSRGE